MPVFANKFFILLVSYKDKNKENLLSWRGSVSSLDTFLDRLKLRFGPFKVKFSNITFAPFQNS